MSLPARNNNLSFEEYLEGEGLAETRHEYVGGEVFAMAGGSARHNLIALNLAGVLKQNVQPKGSCRVHVADMKVIVLGASPIAYCPDVVLTCEAFDPEATFLSAPYLVAEVLSPSTETIDRREKKLNYLQIPELLHYLVVHQDTPRLELHTRGVDGWHSETMVGETISGAAGLDLQCPKMRLFLTDVYDGTALLPETLVPEKPSPETRQP